MDWEAMYNQAMKEVMKDKDRAFTIEQNGALAGYTESPTHEIERQDNAMQIAGVKVQEINSRVIK